MTTEAKVIVDRFNTRWRVLPDNQLKSGNLVLPANHVRMANGPFRVADPDFNPADPQPLRRPAKRWQDKHGEVWWHPVGQDDVLTTGTKVCRADHVRRNAGPLVSL